jgi:anti-sigma regulatory factor (Ser/Thr protein kinase)
MHPRRNPDPRGGSTTTRPFTGADLPDLRAWVHIRAHAWEPGDAADDFVLAVSEIATNAVVHGGGAGTLTLRHDDGQLVCRIADTGPGMADPGAGRTPPPPTATTGYGLWLAHNLTSTVLISTSPAGTTVLVRLSRTDALLGLAELPE